MLKHMITATCNMGCLYCICRDVPSGRAPASYIAPVYKKFAEEGHREIMLTGGEPTIDMERLSFCVLAAKHYFKWVHLTTSNPDFLDHWMVHLFTSVTYSLHGRDVPKVKLHWRTNKFYAAIMADEYVSGLAERAALAGFNGMTINEDQRGEGREFAVNPPDLGEPFSYKVNRRGHCMKETIILPSLDICQDFSELL